MDINFYIPRGCYYLVQNGGTPYWNMGGFSFANIPVWISNVNASTAENIAYIPCFNKTKVAAIIGDSFGDISIDFMALLGANAANQFEGILQSGAEAMRASNSYSPVMISSKGGGVYKFLLTSYGVRGFQDPERNILSFGIQGKIV